jgi:serine protease Do
MHMNKRNLGLALFLGALAVTLIALPGNSAKLQSVDNCAKQIVRSKVQVLAARAQQASQRMADQEESWANVQEIEKMEAPEIVNDVEVFIGDGSWLGVETNEITADKVKELKLPAERGVLVGKIVPDSPAAKAGLKEQDVITELNGQRVEGTSQFRRMIREIPAGRTAQLMLLRNGRQQNVSVTLGKRESHRAGGMMRTPSPGAFAFRIPELEGLPDVEELGELNSFGIAGLGQPRLGIDAEDIQGDLGTYFGAPDGDGILVRRVFSDTPAAKAGIKAGDVITSINGTAVRHVRELREQMKSTSEEKSLKVGLLRNKSELTLDVQMPARVKKEIHQRSERTNL